MMALTAETGSPDVIPVLDTLNLLGRPGGNWPSGPSTGEKAGLETQRSESFPRTG